MKTSARRRWLGYGAAALLTVAAMAWVDRNPGGDDLALPTARVAAAGAAPRARAADAAAPAGDTAAAVPVLQARAESDPLDDPFGAPEEPVVAAPVVAVQREPLPVAPPPAPPPPLPFTYVGRWTEHDKTTIYLQRKDRSVAVVGVGPLDNEYSVQSISDQGIVFRHQAIGALQGLRFDAPPVAEAAAAAAGPARPGSPPEPAPNPARPPLPANGAEDAPQPDN